MKEKRASPKKELNWEYCECGCHGLDLQVAYQYFWCFIHWPESVKDEAGNYKPNYQKPVYDLYDKHKGDVWGGFLGSFNSMAEVNSFVKEKLKKICKEIKEKL